MLHGWRETAQHWAWLNQHTHDHKQIVICTQLRTFAHSNVFSFEHSNVRTSERLSVPTSGRSNVGTFEHLWMFEIANVWTIEHVWRLLWEPICISVNLNLNNLPTERKIFRWPKNWEDRFDFNDFRTNWIAMARSISGKFFKRTKRAKSFQKIRRPRRRHRRRLANFWNVSTSWFLSRNKQ